MCAITVDQHMIKVFGVERKPTILGKHSKLFYIDRQQDKKGVKINTNSELKDALSKESQKQQKANRYITSFTIRLAFGMANLGNEVTLEYLALPLHSQDMEDFSAENVATPAKYRTAERFLIAPKLFLFWYQSACVGCTMINNLIISTGLPGR
jgi:hypothetical protein